MRCPGERLAVMKQSRPMAPRSSQQAFTAAQRRGFVQDVLAELSGRSGDLLPFDQVREGLRLGEPAGQARLEEIPLDRIVGSVGRYRDFNRAFLPRPHLDPARWVRIDQLRGRQPLPPIDVFQVGDAYFVRDGNHRVSVARARGDTTIRAHVIEIPVRVPLGPDTSVDDLILKAEYARFLEATALDHLWAAEAGTPASHIELTRPGGYQSLLQHIQVRQFYMGLRSNTFPSLPEAAADWYRTVYLPIVERIRASGILSRFPGRTEADLYLWIAENRARLQIHYGKGEAARDAVDTFTHEHKRPRLLRWPRRRRA